MSSAAIFVWCFKGYVITLKEYFTAGPEVCVCVCVGGGGGGGGGGRGSWFPAIA